VLYSKVVPAILISSTLACSGGNGAESASQETAVPNTSAASAADLPDPCGLVTDEKISELLWKGMEANQRQALQARNAKHIITKRVENVNNPAGRTCYFQYRRVAGDSIWGEGDFQLRTLARQTFQMFAQSSPSSQDPIPGVGDQAFYLSNAAYARRGDVGVEVVNFNSKDIEIELLKDAVARLP
jgi:hypothetical protein